MCTDMRRHMITVGLKRLKVVLIGSVLVLLLVLGYVTVTGVVNPSQLTQWQGKHIQRKGLLVLADQNAAAQRRLHNQLPTPQYLRRVQMYQDIQKYLENARYNRTVWKELDLRKLWGFVSEPSCSSIETYLNLLQTSSAYIQSRQRQGEVSQYVIGDATPTHFSTHGFWDMLPGNEGCAEPCVTDADVIHHLNPRAKLLLILRNPTTRLYSQYFYKSYIYERKVSKQDFHDLVVTEIAKFQNCLTSQSLRSCCHNYSSSHYLTAFVDLRGSIYQVFLADWMANFPKDQIHVLKFEDFVENEKAHLTGIFKFLNLSNLSDEELEYITNMKALNQRDYGVDVGDMMNSTRALLDTFYKPYNEKLALFMENEKWNW